MPKCPVLLRLLFFRFYRNGCGIIHLFQRGLFKDYPNREIKTFLQEKVPPYEKLSVRTVKLEYIRTLERAEDFFVHKLSFEKVCVIHLFIPFRKSFISLIPCNKTY